MAKQTAAEAALAEAEAAETAREAAAAAKTTTPKKRPKLEGGLVPLGKDTGLALI